MGCALCSLLWMFLCRRLSFDSLAGAQVLLTRLFYRYIFIFVFVFFAAVCFGYRTGSSLNIVPIARAANPLMPNAATSQQQVLKG